MSYEITLEIASPLILAAARTSVPAGGVAAVWRPALDKVWAFLRADQMPNAGLNVFLYHHPDHPGEAMTVDFGVQVLNRFDDQGGLICVATPSGQVAQTVHVGPYSGLGEAHSAIRRWCRENQRQLASASWEIYGHWNDDPQKLETKICYLLA